MAGLGLVDFSTLRHLLVIIHFNFCEIQRHLVTENLNKVIMKTQCHLVVETKFKFCVTQRHLVLKLLH